MIKVNRMKRLTAAGVAAVASLVWAGAAFGAGSAAAEGHGGAAAGNVQSALAGSGSGVLPFTGLSIAIVVVAGLLFVAMGVTMRRASRARA